MSNRQDFTVNTAVLQEAIEALSDLPQKYNSAIAEIKRVSEALLQRKNWKGDTREEFKDTYRIVERYLEDDEQRLTDIVDVLKGFEEIYEDLDTEALKDIYENAQKIDQKLNG